MMQSRLARGWGEISAEARARWPKLSAGDLAQIGGDPTRLVQAVARRYHPGRSRITLEAGILDWLYSALAEIEKR